MATKRKRVMLTAEKKCEVIHWIDKGESQAKIAQLYGIGRSTVSNIFTKRQKVTRFNANNTDIVNSTTLIMSDIPIDMNLENLLRQWCVRCAMKDVNPTKLMVREKTVILNSQLTGRNLLKLKSRWAERFAEHFLYLNKAEIERKSENPNQSAADIFKTEFHKLMRKEEYRLENVYNADITRLRWKTIPEASTFSKKLRKLERKTGNKHVTIFLCSNVTGSHKLPVLVIGMANDPPTIDNFYASVLSIMYKNSKLPFMNSDIFNEWYNDCFLKSVLERQQKNGQREKTLLLLNNAGLDHENMIVSKKDEFINIMHFFYDVTPLIQPMDCGIIACFKRMYRKAFLDILTPISDNACEKQIAYAYSHLQIDNCCCMVHTAWQNVQNPILIYAWDKLFDNKSERSSEMFEIIKKDINEALAKLKAIPGCQGCDSVAVMNWFETDKKYNTDTQIDINDALLEFINVSLDTDPNQFIDENFEDILDDCLL